MWRREGVFKFLKDLLFPVYCYSCGQEGEWWCDECLQEYLKNSYLVLKCPYCGKKNQTGETCYRCEAVSFLDREVAFLFYQSDEIVGRLIKSFKYSFAEEIREVWQKVVERRVGDILGLSEDCDDVLFQIIPIPLHKKRMAERGFNQAEIIAHILSSKIGWPVLKDALKRVKKTDQQAHLSFLARRENIKNAFVWQGKESCPENIILVDDVFTSGATMQEAAQVLKCSGARVVRGITLARGDFV